MSAARTGFLQGFMAGALGAVGVGMLALYVLNITNVVAISVLQVPQIQQLLRWAYQNFGLSLVLFAITLGLFWRSLSQVKRRLADGSSVDQVAQAEHLVDVWTSVFFGIGVIWTAIGMRSALLFALSDPGSVGQDGAFAILERLVDGGILIALSTTIFGAVGGYVMRVFKTLTVGGELQQYYGRAADAQGADIQKYLTQIEAHLRTLVHGSPGPQEPTHDTTSLAPQSLRSSR